MIEGRNNIAPHTLYSCLTFQNNSSFPKQDIAMDILVKGSIPIFQKYYVVGAGKLP